MGEGQLQAVSFGIISMLGKHARSFEMCVEVFFFFLVGAKLAGA